MSDVFCLIIGIIVSVAGAVIVIFGISAAVTCRMPVIATVCHIRVKAARLRGSPVNTYAPKLSYTVNGKEYTVFAPFSTLKKDKYKVGDTMAIKVSEKNPHKCRFDGRYGVNVAGLVLIGIGTLLTVLSLV